jgi:hypothetical protein
LPGGCISGRWLAAVIPERRCRDLRLLDAAERLPCACFRRVALGSRGGARVARCAVVALLSRARRRTPATHRLVVTGALRATAMRLMTDGELLAPTAGCPPCVVADIAALHAVSPRRRFVQVGRADGLHWVG